MRILLLRRHETQTRRRQTGRTRPASKMSRYQIRQQHGYFFAAAEIRALKAASNEMMTRSETKSLRCRFRLELQPFPSSSSSAGSPGRPQLSTINSNNHQPVSSQPLVLHSLLTSKALLAAEVGNGGWPLDSASACSSTFVRSPTPADDHQLASLMYHAYLGTIDYQGESEADALTELRRT